MNYKLFPLEATNCKADLEVSDANLRQHGMVGARIDVNTKNTDFNKNMDITLKPKLETMLFDTRDDKDNQASDVYAYITGDGRTLIISPLNNKATYKSIAVYCKVNN